MSLNCKVIKKSGTPPPFQVYPPFLAKNFLLPPLQVTQFLKGPTPPTPPPFNKGGGAGAVPTMNVFFALFAQI